MKFGRLFREERNAAWSDHYLDYAMLKKVTKLDEETVATRFLAELRVQLRKVQEFMKAHLEAYNAEICSIELLHPARGSERLVHDIEEFQKFAFLNNEAVRKAIKRLLKRFPALSSPDLELGLHLSYLGTTQCGMSQADIESWLHAPAVEFLFRSKAAACRDRGIQLSFWAQELKVGLRMALARICAVEPANPTSIRLSILDEEEEEEEEHLVIQNTFISHGRKRGTASRRTSSAPPGHSCCAASAAEEAGKSDESTTADSGSNGEVPEHPDDPPSSREERLRPAPAAPSRRGQRGRMPCDPGSRWWTATEATCPLTGFPVKLLPYPPFKLADSGAGLSRRKATHLVDGLFFTIQAIATWDFSAFGRPLTSSEIVSLDGYVKKCKLGPFRIGHALRLASSQRSEDKCELDALVARAQRRLAVLKRIQCVRNA